jgi:riboflavin synthase
LTVVALDGDLASFDAIPETIERTRFRALEVGSRVNLERSLRLGDRLGGHIVQGHVDGTATVTAVEDDGFARRLRLAAAPELLRHCVQRGSIALDGVSLTIVALDGAELEVSLVPETLERTTLGELRPGSVVNVEADILAKYVERLLP